MACDTDGVRVSDQMTRMSFASAPYGDFSQKGVRISSLSPVGSGSPGMRPYIFLTYSSNLGAVSGTGATNGSAAQPNPDSLVDPIARRA